MKGDVNMLNEKLKREITIVCGDEKEQEHLGNFIHEQLRGNKDYMDNNIVLNIDVDDTIKIYIFKECENIPDIII